MRTKSAKQVKKVDAYVKSADTVKQTFQLLLSAPAGKFLADPVDKINQDLSSLVEVFLAVPVTLRGVSTSTWSNINLQKWE